MKKIVSLTGHRNAGKVSIALDLAKNSDVAYIRPYTDKEIPLNEIEKCDDYHYVSKDTLDTMIESENVLSITKVNDNRYVFFEFQCTELYNVMILDDYAVIQTKDNWDEEIFTVKVYSDKQKDSNRVGSYLYDHEFDYIFHYGSDDLDELEVLIYYESD